MIPFTYGNARVWKSGRGDRSLDTQLRELANHGFRQELILSDVMTGHLMSRPVWDELMTRTQPKDTIVVVWLDRFSRNFDEVMRIRQTSAAQHRHHRHQGRHRQRPSQVLLPDDGQRRLAGLFEERANQSC